MIKGSKSKYPGFSLNVKKATKMRVVCYLNQQFCIFAIFSQGFLIRPQYYVTQMMCSSVALLLILAHRKFRITAESNHPKKYTNEMMTKY